MIFRTVLKTLYGVFSRIGTQTPEDSLREIVTVLKALTVAVKSRAEDIEDRVQGVEDREIFPVRA
jgi:hypothetical protein